MDLDAVIKQLRTRCPSFSQRVAGAAEYSVLPDAAGLNLPCAYVIPLDDKPSEQRSQNGYRQELREAFAVILRISNKSDERGQAATNEVYRLRREVFRALLGWQINDAYGIVEYEGGNLTSLSRALMDWQLEFSAVCELDASDTFIEVRDDELPALAGFDIGVDPISPFADPNLKQPGPDGRIEFALRIDGLINDPVDDPSADPDSDPDDAQP